MDSITSWFYRLPDKPREIKFWFQRLVRGYGDDDLWGLCGYFTDKILPPLREFTKYAKEHGHGCPAIYVDIEHSDRSVEEGMKAWHADLDKMVLAFELLYEDDYATDSWFAKTAEQHVEDGQKIKEGLVLFAERYQNLWD